MFRQFRNPILRDNDEQLNHLQTEVSFADWTTRTSWVLVGAAALSFPGDIRLLDEIG